MYHHSDFPIAVIVLNVNSLMLLTPQTILTYYTLRANLKSKENRCVPFIEEVEHLSLRAIRFFAHILNRTVGTPIRNHSKCLRQICPHALFDWCLQIHNAYRLQFIANVYYYELLRR